MVSHVSVATVALWGKDIGAVSWDKAANRGFFEYLPHYHGVSIDPLHLPVSSASNGPSSSPVGIFGGSTRREDWDTWKGLPSALADSLPDDFGNALIDAWLARENLQKADFDPVRRLLYTGSRGMGALEYRPALREGLGETHALELDSLVRLAGEVVSQRSSFEARLGGDDTDKAALQSLLQVGTSAGGARPKAVIAMDDHGHIRSGQVGAPKGYGYWLLKFDVAEPGHLGASTSFGRIEYGYARMAKAAGIDMTECRLLEENGRAHFMTRRFDRVVPTASSPRQDGSGAVESVLKRHVLSLCALARADFRLPGLYSYEEALALMRTLKLPREDAIEFFRRMVFNVLARNQDDHTRNTAFLMDPSGAWRLSPAYDLTFAYRADSPWVATHQMTIHGKRDGFVLDDLRAVGRTIGGFDPDPVIQEVGEAVRRWPEFAGEAGVTPSVIQTIAQAHRILPTS
jgi:serine/threonine-protein kinase HipA